VFRTSDRSRWISRSAIAGSIAALILPGLATSAGAQAPARASVNDVTVTEGTGGSTIVTFVVTLSRSDGDTSVTYTTFDQTAFSGADYAETSGTLAFARNETQKTVSIPVATDSLDEPDEIFGIALTRIVDGTFEGGDPTGYATILDDDAAPSISIADATVTEGTGGTTITTVNVSLSAPSGRLITVDFTTADGSATFDPGADYHRSSGRLVFDRGDTVETIELRIVADAVDESNETFFVDLSNAGGAVLSKSRSTVTILDDDSGGGGGGGGGGGSNPAISISDAQVVEGDGSTRTVAITVSLSTSSTDYVSVDYATADGTARFSDADYWRMSGGLVFSPGDTSETLTARIEADSLDEIDEVFYLDLSDPRNGTLADSRGVITILDDDDVASSRTTLTIVRAEDRLVARGTVTPAHPGHEVRVVLKKRRNGRFRTIDRATPSLSSPRDSDGDGQMESRYRTSFERPRSGRCLLKATFPGDADHAKSVSLGRFRC
jgi:hypothetical protein